MAASTLSPLPFNVPIVDPETGNPTPYFARMLLDWLKEKESFEGVTEGELDDVAADVAGKQDHDVLLDSVSALSDPGADKMLFWDESANQFGWLEPAANLAITGTDLDATGGGGGPTVIAALSAPTSNEFNFSGLSLGSYAKVVLILEDVSVTTDDSSLTLTFLVAGTEVTTGYRYDNRTYSSSNSTDSQSSAAAAGILLTDNTANWKIGNGSNKSYSGEVTVFGPGSTAKHKQCRFQSNVIFTSGNMGAIFGGGIMENVGAITGFRIVGSSNITAGKVTLVGHPRS